MSWEVVSHTLNPSIWEAERSEFQVWDTYRASFKIAKATQRRKQTITISFNIMPLNTVTCKGEDFLESSRFGKSSHDQQHQ